jgi:MFS family permease
MSTAFSRQSWQLIIAGGLIVGLSMGFRHSQGLYLLPYTQHFGLSREAYSFAIALQNIIWGLASPFTGMLADRYGSGKVLAGGTVLFVAGVLLMPYSGTRLELSLSAGLLVGLGMAGTAWTVNGAVGRGVPAATRSTALGIMASMGALGQFAMMPFTLYLINTFGWIGSLTAGAATLAIMLPLSAVLAERHRAPAVASNEGSMGDMWRAAFTSRSMWMLWLGFSACGFQLAFIGTHLPSYLIDRGLSARDGTVALALVGLFNIFGTYAFGKLGERYTKKYLIAALYGLRTLSIIIFISVPLSPMSVYIFGAAMGFLWLGISPVMTALVAQMFGLRYLTSVAGFIFLGHQIGSFFGVWLGGLLFDKTGSYNGVWWLAIAIGTFAALMSLPVDERAVRIAPRAAAA